MANRMIRDWTDSERVDKLSCSAEVLFTRLLMKADDFGRYHADARLLKAALFPLRDDLKPSDLIPLLKEIIDAELAISYQNGGREYVEIINFGQRLRVQKSKFPAPEGERANFGTENPDGSPQPADNCRLEEKRREENTKGNENNADKPPIENLENRKIKFGNSLIPFVEKYGAEMIRKFFDYWTELNKSGKTMRWESERFFELSKRLATWTKNDDKFKNNNFNNNQTKNLDDGQRIRKSEK